MENGWNTKENGLAVNLMGMEDCLTKIRVSTLDFGRIVIEKERASRCG